MLCNVHTSQVFVDVHIESEYLRHRNKLKCSCNKRCTDTTGSTLEVMAGNKVVLQATDVLKIDCDVAAKIDATLSIMEIT